MNTQDTFPGKPSTSSGQVASNFRIDFNNRNGSRLRSRTVNEKDFHDRASICQASVHTYQPSPLQRASTIEEHGTIRPLSHATTVIGSNRLRTNSLNTSRPLTHQLPKIHHVDPFPRFAESPTNQAFHMLIMLFAVFCLSTLIIFFLLRSLPFSFMQAARPSSNESQPTISIPHLPTDWQSLSFLASNLYSYASSSLFGHLHVLLTISAVYTWKQSWSIPGSALLNLLIGSLYSSSILSTIICSFLTASGSLLAYQLAYSLRPLANRLLRAFRSSSSSLKTPTTFEQILLTRLVPVLPYAVINIACGLARVSRTSFFAATLVGSIPQNAVFCAIGRVIAELSASGSEQTLRQKMLEPAMVVRFGMLSCMAMAPILLKKHQGSLAKIYNAAARRLPILTVCLHALQRLLKRSSAFQNAHTSPGDIEELRLSSEPYHDMRTDTIAGFSPYAAQRLASGPIPPSAVQYSGPKRHNADHRLRAASLSSESSPEMSEPSTPDPGPDYDQQSLSLVRGTHGHRYFASSNVNSLKSM